MWPSAEFEFEGGYPCREIHVEGGVEVHWCKEIAAWSWYVNALDVRGVQWYVRGRNTYLPDQDCALRST